MPATAEAEVNSNVAAPAAAHASNPVLETAMAAVSLETHLLIPASFSKVKGAGSLSPPAADVVKRARDLAAEMSAPANDKTRKEMEHDAERVQLFLRKSVQALTRLNPEGTPTPLFPRTMEALLQTAAAYPDLAATTVVHPVATHLADQPEAMDAEKRECDVGALSVFATEGVHGGNWEQQLELYEIMRVCWDKSAWGRVLGNAEFLALVGKGGSALCLVMLLFSQEEDDTLTAGQNPTLHSYLHACMRDGLTGGSGTLRDCRRHSDMCLTLHSGTEFFGPRAGDTIHVPSVEVYTALVKGSRAPLHTAMQQVDKVSYEKWVKGDDTGNITMTMVYERIQIILGSFGSKTAPLAEDGATDSGTPAPFFSVNSVDRKRKPANQDPGKKTPPKPPAGAPARSPTMVPMCKPRTSHNTRWSPVDHTDPSLGMPKQCNRDWENQGNCHRGSDCYWTHSTLDGRPVVKAAGQANPTMQPPKPASTRCWNRLCTTAGCSGYHCLNCGLAGHDANACQYRNGRYAMARGRGRGSPGRGQHRGRGRGQAYSGRGNSYTSRGRGRVRFNVNEVEQNEHHAVGEPAGESVTVQMSSEEYNAYTMRPDRGYCESARLQYSALPPCWSWTMTSTPPLCKSDCKLREHTHAAPATLPADPHSRRLAEMRTMTDDEVNTSMFSWSEEKTSRPSPRATTYVDKQEPRTTTINQEETAHTPNTIDNSAPASPGQSYQKKKIIKKRPSQTTGVETAVLPRMTVWSQ